MSPQKLASVPSYSTTLLTHEALQLCLIGVFLSKFKWLEVEVAHLHESSTMVYKPGHRRKSAERLIHCSRDTQLCTFVPWPCGTGRVRCATDALMK